MDVEGLTVRAADGTVGGDLVDIAATILLATTIALALRARSVPLHPSAMWVFVPLLVAPLGRSLFRSPRARRVWFVVWVGSVAGVIASGRWVS